MGIMKGKYHVIATDLFSGFYQMSIELIPSFSDKKAPDPFPLARLISKLRNEVPAGKRRKNHAKLLSVC